MNGFSFPPPPPPPPKPVVPANSGPRGGFAASAGRGRGARGDFQDHDRGSSRGRGRGRGRPNPNLHPLPSTGQTAANGFSDQSHPHKSESQRHSWRHESQHGDGTPSRTAVGHKRKLEALRGPPPKKPENKPAPATAPAVPTFGALPLPPLPKQDPRQLPRPSPNQLPQKAPGRGLGLTPGDGQPQYPSSDNDSDNDDVDEEAMAAELGDKLTFEHNGVVMSLNSKADLLAWKRERQQKWPTKARMMTKEEERREVGEERKRLLAGVDGLYQRASRFSWPDGSDRRAGVGIAERRSPAEDRGEQIVSDSKTAETHLEQAQRDMAEKTKRLDELRRKVAESEARNRKAREQAEQAQRQDNEGVDNLDIDQTPRLEHEGQVVDAAEQPPSIDLGLVSGSSSSESSDQDTDDSSEAGSSDDEAPEELTSKQPSELPTTASTARPICKYFASSRGCRDGDRCAFRHDAALAPPPQRANTQRPAQAPRDPYAPKLEAPSTGRKTIFQRLVEQEEAEDDRLALKVVKYLGEAGFFR